MAGEISIPLTFDTSELEATTRQLATQLEKEVPAAFNKKMGWLLRRWLWHLKSANYAQMARALGLRLRLGRSGEKVTKTGKVIKFKARWKAGGKTFQNQLVRDIKRGGDAVPLIVAMISKRTGGSPYKGVSRAAGRRAMRAAVKKKFGARARSIGYLRSAVASAQKPFLPFSSGPSAVPPIENDRSLRPVGRPKGFGTIAQPGNQPVAIAVDASITKRQRDQGLVKFSRPALEKAYAEELKDTQDFLNETLYQTARKLGISAKR